MTKKLTIIQKREVIFNKTGQSSFKKRFYIKKNK